MGLQVGGSMSNQSGSGANSGSMSSSTTGTQTGTQTGSQTGSTSSSSTPVLSDQWLAAFNELTGATGAQGLTPEQQTAASYFKDQMANGGTTHLANMAQRYPELYGQQPEVVAAKIGDAGVGADFMAPYEKGYTDDVLTATMADLEQAFKESQNQLRGQYGGAGWSASAGAPGAVQIAAAQGADDYLRTRATTGAGIRDQGFTRAMQGGMADRDSLQQRNIAQAGLDTQASAANAGILDSRQKFDATRAAEDERRRDSMADRLFGTGQSGFENLISIMSGAGAANGMSNTGTTSGTTTGTTMGTTESNTTGNTASNFWNRGSGNQAGASVGGK